MKTVLYPPEIVDISQPVIFLAGPVQGAADWQTQAIEFIHGQHPEIIIANPRKVVPEDLFNHTIQSDWELHYLQKASVGGCILFWLAKEETHNCERPFAKTTGQEYGFFIGKCFYDRANIAVGCHARYPSRKYSIHLLKKYGRGAIMHNDLFDTCQTAIRTCLQK